MPEVFAAMSRVEMAGVAAMEVFFVTLILFVGGAAALSPIVWFVLVIAGVVAQSFVFYNVGRQRQRRSP